MPDCENEPFERISRIAFYYGASLMLAFITWMQIAPYTTGPDPVWWNGEMAQAAALGMFFLCMSILIPTLGIFWDLAELAEKRFANND